MNQVLHFWKAIEYFSPQTVPPGDAFSRTEPVFNLLPKDKLPWEGAVKHRWAYQIYCGLMPLDGVREALERAFGKCEEAFDARVDGETALFSFVLGKDLVPFRESFVLSMCAWAMSRLKHPGPSDPLWLNGYEKDAKDFLDIFAARSYQTPITYEFLAELTKKFAETLGLEGVSRHQIIRIRAFPAARFYPQDFLNSFYVTDLSRIILLNDFGKGLLQYTGVERPERVDVRKEEELKKVALAPKRYPRGAWPHPGCHSLVLNQQLALNLIRSELKSGLFAINGPPGTGKTTLLRDLIAHVVVERAILLSETSDISLAKLKGFEMVLASNNNGAVENVTLEIPGRQAVDPAWMEGFDYFTPLAEQLVGKAAWGLIATRLGNKSNCFDFISRFIPGIHVALNEAVDWPKAVSSFKEALAEEAEMRRELSELSAIDASRHEVMTVKKRLLDEVEGLYFQIGEVPVQACRLEVERLEKEVEQAFQRCVGHQQLFPRFWDIIFSLGKAYRRWRDRAFALKEACDDKEKALAEALSLMRAEEEKIKWLEKQIFSLQAEIEEQNQALETIEERLFGIETKYGVTLDETWNELSYPWKSDRWLEARIKLFLSALQLHKAFILANAKLFQKNITLLADLLCGAILPQTPKEAIQEAFTALFFIIPLVSTTFASIARLFSHLGREEIGWLIIDEAGQAPPQTAVGAIWRAKKTVVLGDPFQLEPLVSIPYTAQQALRLHYGVAPTWVPGTSSAQALADLASRFGTTIGPRWIGFPLQVHRRSEHRIFEIINKMSYQGLMVYGTSDRPSTLPTSHWIDVVGTEYIGHWNLAEGVALTSLLQNLLGQGVKGTDIFLVSPFRAIVQNLSRLARAYSGIKSGTVHTMQGKEAEIVILVLGGHPSKPGAKRWVSAKPNLLNVAISRAKTRLYVIGNRQAWSPHPHIKEILEVLG